MTIGTRSRTGGGKHSYLSAACPALKGTKTAAFPLALASFYFADGQSLSATVTKSCGVRE
jgi:hypothetical protein